MMDEQPEKISGEPLNISKDQELIKDAQKDMGKLDVLVCGECNDVFHFIEKFQEHKSVEGECSKNSPIKENHGNESKSQVWAFMLWKHAQYKVVKDDEERLTTWSEYQKWCKLEPDERLTWITAGDEIHHFSKIAAGKLQEMKLKNQLQKVAKKTITKPNLVTVSSLQSMNVSSDDPLEEGEIALNERKDSTEMDPLGDITLGSEADTEVDENEHNENKIGQNKIDPNDLIKKGLVKPVQLNSDVTILPSIKKSINTKKAIRTSRDDNNKEYAVEKILSKRYNPKKKSFEYLIKWENFNSSQNTWEPTAHITGCKLLIEEFERNLQKQKALKASKANILQKRADKEKAVIEEIKLTPGGRPQRTSKQKALNQVKVWCGDISDADEVSAKRKFDDDSDSDSFEKRIKTDDYSDSTDEEKPSITIKRITKPASVNGVGKKNLLVTDAQGIVRLNPKQVSSLKSGVYIMNKSKGLIKLDSNSAKIPSVLSGTALNQTPKIVGQTRIKIVRKDNANTGNLIRLNPKTSASFTTKLKQQPGKVIAKPVVKLPNSLEKVLSMSNMKDDEESSDGVEELEFPTDCPIPPDSPPGEYTLDPLTGELVGQVSEQPPSQETNDSNSAMDMKTKKSSTETEIGSTSDQITTETNRLIEVKVSEDVKEDVHGTDNVLDKTHNATEKKVDAVKETDAVVDESPKDTKKTADETKPDTNLETIDDLSKKLSEITDDMLHVSKISKNEESLKRNGKISEPTKSTNTTTSGAASLIDTLSLPEITLTSTKVPAVTSAIATASVTKSISKPNSSILCTALTDKNLINVPERKLLSGTNVQRQRFTPNKIINKPVKKILPGQKPFSNKVITPKGKMPLSGTPIISRVQPKTYSNKSSLAKKAHNRTILPIPTTNVIEVSRSSIVHNKESKSTIPTTNVIEISQSSIVHNKESKSITSTQPPPVINMPLLAADEEEGVQDSQKPQEKQEEDANVENLSLALTETEAPLFITGDDGTIYQIAGQNEQGQTVLISQGADGQQQCLVVAAENSSEINQVITGEENVVVPSELGLQEPLTVQTEESEMQADNGDTQVDAQIVKAEPPSPGGTRKVLLLLPDGNLMMTELSPDQYNSLELDK